MKMTISISEVELKNFKSFCEDTGRSQSSAVRKAIRDLLALSGWKYDRTSDGKLEQTS